MKPAPVDLPTIWRGSDWPTIIFKWKDHNGNPMPLTGWQFKAQTRSFDLNGAISDASQGFTSVTLTHEQTGSLKLGVEGWNCWFIDPGGKVTPPLLAGKVPIKEKLTIE